MSDYTEYAEYYKKHWEKTLSERTSKLETELDAALMVIADLKATNARYRSALEIISKEETDSILPVNLYIAPTDVKRNYMDEAYRLIAREALKENE